MTQNLLLKFGLSEKESRVYLALLQYGTQPTSMLAKRCQLNRGTTFLALKALTQKGFATMVVKNEMQYYTAIPPRYLNTLLLKKKEELNVLERDLKDTLPLLISLQNPRSPLPKIRFFEGQDSLRLLLEDTLTAKDKKLCGILSMKDLYDVFGEEYFEDYVHRRIATGVNLRVMRNKIKDIKKRWANDPKKELRTLQYLPRTMVFPATMYLYDGKVMFISSQKEEFGVLIESEEIYQIQMKLFETLWNTQKTR